MIKIIKGSYGLKVDGVVTAMRPGSDPFSLSEAREAELVALGVAEKVETAESDTQARQWQNFARRRQSAA